MDIASRVSLQLQSRGVDHCLISNRRETGHNQAALKPLFPHSRRMTLHFMNQESISRHKTTCIQLQISAHPLPPSPCGHQHHSSQPSAHDRADPILIYQRNERKKRKPGNPIHTPPQTLPYASSRSQSFSSSKKQCRLVTPASRVPIHPIHPSQCTAPPSIILSYCSQGSNHSTYLSERQKKEKASTLPIQ